MMTAATEATAVGSEAEAVMITAEVAVKLPSLPVMVAEPAATPETTPLVLPTVALLGALEL